MEQKPVKHKVLLTLDSSIYNRVSSEAGQLGIGIATMCRILISEACSARENRDVMWGTLSKLKDITPEQFDKMISQVPESDSAPPLVIDSSD